MSEADWRRKAGWSDLLDEKAGPGRPGRGGGAAVGRGVDSGGELGSQAQTQGGTPCVSSSNPKELQNLPRFAPPGPGVVLVPTMGTSTRATKAHGLRPGASRTHRGGQPVRQPHHFGPNEDLTLTHGISNRDQDTAKRPAWTSCSPRARGMYAPDRLDAVTVDGVSAGLCVASRPTHFRAWLGCVQLSCWPSHVRGVRGRRTASSWPCSGAWSGTDIRSGGRAAHRARADGLALSFPQLFCPRASPTVDVEARPFRRCGGSDRSGSAIRYGPCPGQGHPGHARPRGRSIIWSRGPDSMAVGAGGGSLVLAAVRFSGPSQSTNRGSPRPAEHPVNRVTLSYFVNRF
jgi:hypothetical protein